MAKKDSKKSSKKPVKTKKSTAPLKKDLALALTEKEEPSLKKILSLIKVKTQVDLTGYKMSTIRRRVDRQMSLQKFKTMEEYSSFLASDSQSLLELYRDIFIHVTCFFRDPDSFKALSEFVLPEIVKDKKPKDPLRIWIPGCSTGEEVYSIAILVMEYLEKEKLNLRPHIFATDICDASIQAARRGVYADAAVKKVGAKRLKRFFEKSKEGFKVSKQIRELCVFSQHDLTSNPPFSKLDFVSCRNVLIYFGTGLQKKVIPVFNYALNPRGFLWLGSSESIGNFSKFFKVIDKKNKIFMKTLPMGSLPIVNTYHIGTEGTRLIPVEKTTKNDVLYRTAEQILLNRYAPAGVIVNSGFDIINFRGKTHPFLALPSGQPSHDLFKMIHPDLSSSLHLLLQSVRKTGNPARKEGLKLKEDKVMRTVNIEVSLLNPSASEAERQFLIIFEAAKSTAGSKIKNAPSEDQFNEKHIEELAKELEVQRDYLKSVHEQYEASQEELMSANEELQASNEELQSTNEELETAKEELQSANESLISMNRELEGRNTELRQVNEALAKSEERFRLLVESVRDYAIFMLDPNGIVVSWNQGAKNLKGYEAKEVIGQHFSKFYSKEDIEMGKPRREIMTAIEEGRVEDEGWRVRKDGSKFWANVIITRINDQQGNLIGFSKVTQDLSERKKAEEKLRASEEKFRTMVTSVKDYAIFMLDPQGNVASWNEGARRIKGYEANEIIGRHFSTFYLPEDIQRHHPEHELEIVKKEGKYEEESWRVRKDGSLFWANVVITRLDDPYGKLLGFVKVTRDLSERKRHEEELKKAFQGLEERVRERTRELEIALKSRDEFLSIASHELKTPLTTLKLQLQMSKRKIESNHAEPIPSADLEKTFEVSLKQVNSLSHLVEDLLDVSRIQSGVFNLHLQEFDLTDLVEEIVARFSQQLASAGCSIELHFESGLTGEWDRVRLEQVIVNLLFNAIKYAPGKPIHLFTSATPDKAQLIVQDFGPGIPKDKQGRIFDRFERLNSDHQIGGLGLGLFITRRIVEAHQGTIKVESDAGKGSKFIVELPR